MSRTAIWILMMLGYIAGYIIAEAGLGLAGKVFSIPEAIGMAMLSGGPLLFHWLTNRPS